MKTLLYIKVNLNPKEVSIYFFEILAPLPSFIFHA